jgi:hypothetical protein
VALQLCWIRSHTPVRHLVFAAAYQPGVVSLPLYLTDQLDDRHRNALKWIAVGPMATPVLGSRVTGMQLDLPLTLSTAENGAGAAGLPPGLLSGGDSVHDGFGDGGFGDGGFGDMGDESLAPQAPQASSSSSSSSTTTHAERVVVVERTAAAQPSAQPVDGTHCRDDRGRSELFAASNREARRGEEEAEAEGASAAQETRQEGDAVGLDTKDDEGAPWETRMKWKETKNKRNDEKNNAKVRCAER